MPTICFDILPKCGDFILLLTQLKRQGAMCFSGGDYTQAQHLSDLTHLRRRGIGCQINIRCIPRHHRIAYTATNIEQLKARTEKFCKYRGQDGPVQFLCCNLHGALICSAKPRRMRAVAPQI